MSATSSRNIVVMRGGPSAEREVSLRSGAAVARALASRGHAVTELDPRDDRWNLPAGTEVVFLALHGQYGEDGTVQDRLEVLGVPYTGCGPEASRLAFDKASTKRRCEAVGVPTPRSLLVREVGEAWPEGWEPPVVVKPVRQGSSVGLAIVGSPAAWPAALRQALEHDSTALVEEQIIGRELTVGLLAGEALPVVEVRPRSGTYGYHDKYTAGATEYLCPAPLSGSTTLRVQRVAERAFIAVGGRDYARVDVMLDAREQPWVLEVNTLPGMTETSLFPRAAAAAGLDFSGLCERMVELALRRKTSD